MSQQRLATAVGLTRSTYWRLEHGRFQNPPLRYLTNCAIALGCELGDLIEPAWLEWHVFDHAHAPAPPSPAALWSNDP